MGMGFKLKPKTKKELAEIKVQVAKKRKADRKKAEELKNRDRVVPTKDKAAVAKKTAEAFGKPKPKPKPAAAKPKPKPKRERVVTSEAAAPTFSKSLSNRGSKRKKDRKKRAND